IARPCHRFVANAFRLLRHAIAYRQSGRQAEPLVELSQQHDASVRGHLVGVGVQNHSSTLELKLDR
ncbi:MAG: hypothetical protein KF773_32470, partial [Deltaproteobacteria bacterium]|nr:hypothetical protein [Deltaproteobacteria bacterium]MCW5808915.1 hypothetical protein [Deltaproteobacteria bacterium]